MRDSILLSCNIIWRMASSVSCWKGQLEPSLIKKGCDGECLRFAGSVARQMEGSWGG